MSRDIGGFQTDVGERIRVDVTDGDYNLHGEFLVDPSFVIPIQPNGIASKQYVDSMANGLLVKAAASHSTTQPLLGETFGAGGVTFSSGTLTQTNPANGVFGALDGVSSSLNDRILIKDQTSTIENGIYNITSLGDGVSIPWVLTRSVDADESNEVSGGMTVFVLSGTVNAKSTWVVHGDALITVNTDPIVFAQLSGSVFIDETKILYTDGTRTMNAPLDMANNNVTNVNQLIGYSDGLTLSGNGQSVAVNGSLFDATGGLTVLSGQTLTLTGVTVNGLNSASVSDFAAASSAFAPVQSVAGQTGDVTLSATDFNALSLTGGTVSGYTIFDDTVEINSNIIAGGTDPSIKITPTAASNSTQFLCYNFDTVGSRYFTRICTESTNGACIGGSVIGDTVITNNAESGTLDRRVMIGVGSVAGVVLSENNVFLGQGTNMRIKPNLTSMNLNGSFTETTEQLGTSLPVPAAGSVSWGFENGAKLVTKDSAGVVRTVVLS